MVSKMDFSPPRPTMICHQVFPGLSSEMAVMISSSETCRHQIWRCLEYSMSQTNVSKNVLFCFEKREIVVQCVSSRSVPFPSINCSVSFRSVLSRFVAFCVFILGRQVHTLLQLETLRERCLTPSTCEAEHLFCTLEG